MASGDQQPSFKTNVNRMKTKRWVEAKSYTYDGDDWGDADEYDEYDGYNEEPAPAPGPAAHAGSSRQTSSGYAQEPRQQIAPFPGAPPQPAYMHPQPRSGSPGRPPFAQDPRDRSGSFDRGDERRNFSGSAAPGSPVVAPLRTAYNSAPRNQSPMGRAQQRSPTYPIQGPAGYGRPSIDQQLPPPGAPFAGADNSGRTWSMGSQGSMPFAQRRDYSPSGAQHTPQPQPLSRPPRKSSLSQANAPDPAFIQQTMASQGTARHEADNDHDADPSSQQSPESAAPKIIRPADIYKRVAEEKERERASQESGRPSMSDIMRDRDTDFQGEGHGAGLRPRKATLDTVAERKSEYGMDGMLNQGAATAEALSLSSANMTEEQRKRFSTSPQLPQFSSGFGDDWMSEFGSGTDEKRSTTTQPDSRAGLQESTGLGLTHKPSEGFRSVVHQAFDEPVSAVSAVSGNTEVNRSDTTSTNAISPIISRNPSKEQDKSKAAELRAINMGAIAEEGNIGAPHEGGKPSPIQQIDGKAQPTDELPPPGFVPGHRRNTSIPSPGNSPARQPKLEVRNTPQAEAEAAEAARSEEVETRRRAASEVKAIQIQGVVESLAQKARETPIISPTRAESPSKGRVRDLVDKAESASSSRRGSDSSQTGGLRPNQDRADSFRPQLPGGWNSYVTNPASPSPERGVSPNSGPLSQPGVSEETRPSSLPGAAVNPTLLGKGDGASPSENVNPNTATEGIDIEPTTRKRSVVQDESESVDPTQNPLAAAKAAGAALAGAVTAAAGLGIDKQHESSPHQYGPLRGQQAGYEKGGNSFYPESSRPLMPPSVDSTATSILPSSRGYSPSRTSEEPSEDDIPAVAPLRQRGPGVPGSPVMENNVPASSGAETTPRAPFVSAASPKSSFDENDRLRDDIVRHLTPNPPVSEASTSHPPTPTPNQAYPMSQPASLPQPSAPAVPAPQPLRQAKPKTLKHRFSWEADSESEEELPVAPVTQPTAPQATLPPSTKPGAIIAPTQTIMTVRSDPIPELDSAPSSFQHNFMGPATPAAQEDTQPKELPALRMSSDTEEARQIPELSVTPSPKEMATFDERSQITSPPLPQGASKTDVSPMSPSDDSPTIEQHQFQPPSQGARQRGQTLSNSQVQVPAFREILAMKSPDERLRVYRSTQETFYSMNTGLSNWIQMMGERHPEHKPLLQSSGNFATPTPGLPAPTRPQQTGTSAASGSGTGFSGLRKAGAAAAPSMNDAGAVLKSAGRDTKKLAKGLFAKGRSKFGRDKGSSKLAPFSSPPQKFQPYRPGAVPSPPQVQAPYAPYRPGQPPPPPVVLAPSVGNRPAAPAPVPSAKFFQHTANQKSLPDLPPEPKEPSVAPRPSDVSDMTSISTDDERHGFIPIAFSAEPESPPDAKPVLTQRLTIHQKDIKPFEASFPSDLLGSSAYKEHVESHTGMPPVPSIPVPGQPGTPREEEEIPDQSTPTQGKFPKRSQSLSAGRALASRTLDPGVETFNTTPSWLNFDPQSSPANSDLFSLTSPRSIKSSPATATKSKRASLQIPLQDQSSIPGKALEKLREEPREQPTPTAGTEDRPFSFINFASRPQADFTLDEEAYRVPSRQSSVFTASTEDYDPSRPSTHEDSLRHEISRDESEDADEENAKPLPSLPTEAAEAHRIAMGPGAINHFATMPARQAPKVSLFPQTSSSRPGTSEREPDNFHGDFGPRRLQGRPQEQSASMPVAGAGPEPKQRRHKRGLSGGKLLQRALTAGMNTLESTLEAPRRERNVVKAEKTDKKKRRFSGLHLLGKPKVQTKRVPIDDPTPPGTSHVKGGDGAEVKDGGLAGLAGNTRAFEQPQQHASPSASQRPFMQRPNIPDPIHVAPIEGYYSPEGDATRPTPTTTSPLPQSHIASQFRNGSPRSLPPSSSTTSPKYMPGVNAADVASQTPSPAPRSQRSPPLQTAQNMLPPNFQSAFNESNHVLRHAQGHLSKQQPPGPPPQQPIPQPPQAQQHLPPLSSPPHTQLPQLPPQAPAQLPHLAQTLQREATLRTGPRSPAQPIDPEQLVPGPISDAASSGSDVPSQAQLDRRSLEAFPRPPSKSSQTSHSPGSRSHSRLAGAAPGSHSPDSSLSTARRSRGPSLSVDTNLANNGRASRLSAQANANSNGASQKADEAATAADTKGADSGAQEEEEEIEDDLPSGLSALQRLEQEPPGLRPQKQVQAQNAAHMRARAPIVAAEPGFAAAVVPNPVAAASNPTTKPKVEARPETETETGVARKMSIQPAALRRMRQREIELGGETRLNSPLALGSVMEPMPTLRLDTQSASATSADVSGSGSGKQVVDLEQAEEHSLERKEEEKENEASDDEKEVLRSAHLKPDGAEEDRIVMSATSGPGQEWNPYEQAWM